MCSVELSRLVQAVMRLTCVSDVSGADLVQDTDYHAWCLKLFSHRVADRSLSELKINKQGRVSCVLWCGLLSTSVKIWVRFKAADVYVTLAPVILSRRTLCHVAEFLVCRQLHSV